MAPPRTGLKALNLKHYILAALMAILAVAVVVTVFSVLLSPARIFFSVTNPRSHLLVGNGGANLTFTLAANNTSQRAAVWYNTILVDVLNSTVVTPASIWTKADLKKNATSLMAGWQTRGSVATVDATVSVSRGSMAMAFINGADVNSSAFTVTVTAVARFKVGIAKTQLYDINVMCTPVIFLLQNRSGISVAASGANVDCGPY
ncbi:hypothetical protein Zm00014a_013835 [Zea mays]|jgi:hypothetical protein|uniref:Late embryogenesis abundant protein LEA-2 subgroup domain-containing protein n=2 Tax=Zea mays TaxID=4577 RepID=A0A1D6LK10_MAIZE|nr:hypothetical protein ZEAMMB73_Zm00001d035978 [Zea mays]PWZ17972.1 hypothetical protein Zm00014a_013835 [Zea mays]